MGVTSRYVDRSTEQTLFLLYSYLEETAPVRYGHIDIESGAAGPAVGTSVPRPATSEKVANLRQRGAKRDGGRDGDGDIDRQAKKAGGY